LMKNIIAVLLILFSFHLHAQPWAGLPRQKKAYNQELDEVNIFLQKDTLMKYAPNEMHEKQSDLFYQDSVDLVGFGYKDKDGHPYGVWKYYTHQSTAYELFCEGYYTLLKPDYLFADTEIVKDYPSASAAENKDDFKKNLKDRMMFTGEWRFYRNGRIDKIVLLENHVLIPYERVGEMEGYSTKNETLVLPVLHRRKAGAITMAGYFSPSGYLEKMMSGSRLLEFTRDGKPVLQPLTDLAFPL